VLSRYLEGKAGGQDLVHFDVSEVVLGVGQVDALCRDVALFGEVVVGVVDVEGES